MKRISFILICTAISLLLCTACATTKNAAQSSPQSTAAESAVTPEPAVAEGSAAKATHQPGKTAVSSSTTEEDEEYVRSTSKMEGNVTKEVFSEDKKAILQKIAELDAIMKNHDYNSWHTYIDDESLAYWQDMRNLHKISTRLPIKGIKVESLEDYFKYVFIQSRIGRQIDEIRYISDTSIKAVQVRDQQDIVFYYFHKINGEWKLHLPPLED